MLHFFRVAWGNGVICDGDVGFCGFYLHFPSHQVAGATHMWRSYPRNMDGSIDVHVANTLPRYARQQKRAHSSDHNWPSVLISSSCSCD